MDVKTKGYYTFTLRPVITKEQVQSITRKASLMQKFCLLFVRSQWSVDGSSIIRYKKMGDTLYVMKRGTKL